jgi:hypothetical protein
MYQAAEIAILLNMTSRSQSAQYRPSYLRRLAMSALIRLVLIQVGVAMAASERARR